MASPPLTWQQQCTQTLEQAVAAGGTVGMMMWQAFRDHALQQGNRVVIADADFSHKGLEGFDLSRCWIGRTSFVGANLTNSFFMQSIFRECDATDATIEGTNFRNADMEGDGLILNTTKFDEYTDVEVPADKMPDAIDPGLRLAAVRARSTRRWRFRKSQSWLVRAILWLTDYGFSLKRISICGVGVTLGFAVIYSAMGTSPVAALLASAAYFMSLDATFTTPLLSAIGVFEALLGMIFFALLTTILVSLFFDKH